MGPLSQRYFVNLLFCIALLLSIGSGFFAYQQVQRLLDINAWVSHTYEVIGKANQTLLSVTQADLLMHDYLVSNDQKALQHLPILLNAAAAYESDIRQLTRDNLRQQNRLSRLEPLIKSESMFLQQVAKQYSQAHTQAILPLPVHQKSHVLADQIKQIVEEINQEELTLLKQRNLESRRDAMQSSGMVIGSVGVSVLLLVFSFGLLNYQLRRRNAAERKGMELENQLKKMIDGSRDLIAALDRKYNFIAFNTAYAVKFKQLFHQELKIGLNLQSAIANDVRYEEIIKIWQRALNGEEFSITSQLEKNEDQSEHVYEMTFSAIRGVHNQLIGASHIMRDVTARVKVEKLKDEFISVVSHELRTPLTSIRGALGILLDGAANQLDEKMLKMLNIAENNTERLIILVNNMLDIEKMASGKIELHLIPIDLNQVVEEVVVANYAKGAKASKPIKLQKSAIKIIVKLDVEHIKQVLNHFISNALKYSPVGEEVLVMISADDQWAKVAVTDHGAGIPLDFQKNIFKKFAMADASSTRKLGGAGLGLSISKSIIDRHQGEVGFTSKPHEETVFYFKLPILADTKQ